MNVASLAPTAHINKPGPDGNVARGDYHMEIAKKLNEQVKQEGESAVKLIESAPTPSDGIRGTKLNRHA